MTSLSLGSCSGEIPHIQCVALKENGEEMTLPAGAGDAVLLCRGDSNAVGSAYIVPLTDDG